MQNVVLWSSSECGAGSERVGGGCAITAINPSSGNGQYDEGEDKTVGIERIAVLTARENIQMPAKNAQVQVDEDKAENELEDGEEEDHLLGHDGGGEGAEICEDTTLSISRSLLSL
jgi:hypothetical protein